MSLGDALDCKCYSSERKGFTNANVAALKGEVFWQPGAKENQKVILRESLTQQIYWVRHKKVAASAQVRNSRHLSRGGKALYRVSRRQSFLEWIFPG